MATMSDAQIRAKLSDDNKRINSANADLKTLNGVTVPALTTGVNKAQTSANAAQTSANNAQTSANGAQTSANAAQSTANTANTAAGTAQSGVNAINTRLGSANMAFLGSLGAMSHIADLSGGATLANVISKFNSLLAELQNSNYMN